MRIARSRARQLLPLASVLLAAGAAWWRDARRRDKKAAVMHRTMVELLLNTLCAGDPVTARHSRRVADLTNVLARRYGLGRDRHARLRVASLLHDVGKLDDRLVPIVHSRHRLSPSERRQVNRHPHEGADILEPLEALHPGISLIVESHHECWDGRGYPRGLSGEEIPLEARIISVADVFDALTQRRSYRDPLPVDEALIEIRTGAGSRFDPAVVARLEEAEVLQEWTRIAEEGQRVEAQAQPEEHDDDAAPQDGAPLADAGSAGRGATRGALPRTEA